METILLLSVKLLYTVIIMIIMLIVVIMGIMVIMGILLVQEPRCMHQAGQSLPPTMGLTLERPAHVEALPCWRMPD